MNSLFFIQCICLVPNIKRIYGTPSFNYEVGYRVEDNIKDYLSEISKVISQPYQMIKSELFNITLFESYDTIASPYGLPNLFYTLKSVYYDEINSVAIGFYNGIHGSYSNDNKQHILFSYVNTKFRRTRFTVKSNGQPDNFYINDTFNILTRTPYILAKTKKVKCWSSPFFLQALPSLPVISIVHPFFNSTFSGKYNNFVGTIIGTISLQQISLFLSSAYMNSDRKVFLVEKSSGTLIANSMGSSVSASINGKLVSTLY